jgi:cytochrome c
MAQRSDHGGVGFSGAFIAVTFIIGMVLSGAPPAQAAGDPARGETLYHGCQACHAIDKNGIGPMHKGVFGRESGKVPGYEYSPALQNANLVWTEDNLDKWLTSPQKLVPGTKMFYLVKNQQDRADIIEFLKERAQ